jgi:SAM-dependent methyltransferase
MHTPTFLDQAKLDVRTKLRSNLFNWRGQFTPQFAEYLLDTLAPRARSVLDPFCGSGTVLLESARRGIGAVGCEINPAAYAMSKFFTLCKAPLSERESAIQDLGKRVSETRGLDRDLPLFAQGDQFREQASNVLGFAEDLLGRVRSKMERLLALLLIFQVEDSSAAELSCAVRNGLDALGQKILSLPVSKSEIRVEMCDARLCHLLAKSQFDIVITSPPYINVFNYHQNHRAIVELLGFDVLRVAQSEMGSNRKNRGNRFRTVVEYCLEAEQTIDSLAKAIGPEGLLVLIIGRESRVRRIAFSNSAIWEDLAASVGCFERVGNHQRVFTNRFGLAITEDILILQRNRKKASLGGGRSVAKEHLGRALLSATGDVRNDIHEALSNLEAIEPSPFFDRKDVI